MSVSLKNPSVISEFFCFLFVVVLLFLVGVVDFAVLARLIESMLGVTSWSLFRMSGVSAG